MILTPTQEDIVNSFIENLQVTIPELSTTPISVVREALINPAASQIGFLFDLSKRISTIQDIFSATGSDLDILAKTYGITRRTGTSATGIVYLDLTQLLVKNRIAVSAGAQVKTKGSGSSSTSFTIVGTYTFSSSDRAIFEANAASIRSQLDSVGLSTVRLVAPVPIQALSAGTRGVVGSFTITSANLTDISNVINISPTSGGSDSESDDSLRSRIVNVFTGNSVGTASSLLAAATTPSSISGGFVVKYGDPLMTRDGSKYDELGNLITPGTGRAVDVYIQGTALATSSQRYSFELKDSNFLSFQNAILVGETTKEQFGFLPATSVSSIVGEETAASFSQGTPVEDEEGNILIEGNFALVRDVDCSKYKIVSNLITGERKLATFLSPTSTKYTIVETLEPSEFANSPFSKDRILFLKNKVAISAESITRGTYNGADNLIFQNVTDLDQVYQDITITETIKISDFTDIPGGIQLTLAHYPILSIESITNQRLGVKIEGEILDSNSGSIKLAGRFPPRAGDYVLITYVWRKFYKQKINYSLVGDMIDWLSFADEKGRSDNTLLASQSLSTSLELSLQPTVPSNLVVEVNNIPDREIVQVDISGTTTTSHNLQPAIKLDAPYKFGIVGTSNIGRLLKVSNITKGIDYNLINYKLRSNQFDNNASVSSGLLPQHFLLDNLANEKFIEVGDQLVLGRKRRVLSWSSQSDFFNNISDNLAPIYDPTTLEFLSGGLGLSNPNLAEATLTISGTLTSDTTLSGCVEIVDDLFIPESIVVDIEPGTIIKVRSSDQLTSQLLYTQKVLFDPLLLQNETVGEKDEITDTYSPPSLPYDEYYYIFFRPTTLNSSTFTILNSVGENLTIKFDRDILKKVVSEDSFAFYLNGLEISSSFNNELNATIDLNDLSTSIKCTLLGARSGLDGNALWTSALISEKGNYYVLLEKTPLISSNSQNDFQLNATEDSSFTYSRFAFDSSTNLLAIDKNILIDGYGILSNPDEYVLGYQIENQKRISIVVEGTLRILNANESNTVLFTSSSQDAKPGDWEGILFGTRSHSTNPRTLFQSNLEFARIRFANVGVKVLSSDVKIANCIIRDCLSTGISVASSPKINSGYSADNYTLTSSTNPLEKFIAVSRRGYASNDQVRIARYLIPDSLVTSLGTLPRIKEKLTDTSYVVDLIEGIDFKLFLDNQSIRAIDLSIPADGYTDHSLIQNQDYFIEYDINTGYSLVFLFTFGTTRARNVYNLILDLSSKLKTGNIALDYFSALSNSLIYNNLIINTVTGISTSSIATVSINKNTIDNTSIGIVGTQTIASLRNNIITNYSLAPLSLDNESLIRMQRCLAFSEKVSQDNNLVDRDLLLQSITTLSSLLLVRTPAKFKPGMLIEINNEQMLVQGVNDNQIIVARAQNQTALDAHTSGSTIKLYQLNQTFTVTGIDGDYCELIETDSFGTMIPTSVPISMQLVSNNTFRAILPTNRRVDFYYRYRYRTKDSIISNMTLTKVYPRIQFGKGVNDLVNILHEIPLTSVDYTPNNENYSIDPSYTNSSSSDYSFSALESFASKNNPIFGSLSIPLPLHRYVGYLDVEIQRILQVGDTKVQAPFEPLIVTDFTEVEIVGVDYANSGIVLPVKEFRYESDGSYFILDLDSLGVQVAGAYSVRYVRPVDLGSSLSPYYLSSSISYTLDAKASVLFNLIKSTKDNLGGLVATYVRVADSISNLINSSYSEMQTDSEIDLQNILISNYGRAIEIKLELKGNDGSFLGDGTYNYPLLKDFTLEYLPNKDLQTYKVLSLSLNRTQNETNILIDRPITSSSFQAVGQDPSLELYLRKRADNFAEESEFVIGEVSAIGIGQTTIKALSDITTSKPDSSTSDIVRVDYVGYSEDQIETLWFTQDGNQFTSAEFANVSSINTKVIHNSEETLPSTETIAIYELSQPPSGEEYFVTYNFEAPLPSENLLIQHTYNEAVRLSSQQVELKKSIFSDVLVKEVKVIEIRLVLVIEIESTNLASAVQSDVSQAIAQLFDETFVDIQTERILNVSDIVRATGTIIGINDIKVTTLSQNLINNEIQDPIVISKRESAKLEEGSPRIVLTYGGKVFG